MRRYAIPGLAVLAVGCNPAPPANEAAATTNGTAAQTGSETGNVQRVLALPVGQQRGVVLRAIQDGGGECQTITEFKPQPIDQGRAVWAVRCDAGQRWIVAVGDDGIATASGLPAGG